MVLPMSRPSQITRSDTYYFRKRVPADLVAVVGRKEIRISLGTKDPLVAKERHLLKEQEIANEWASLRSPSQTLSHRQLTALAGQLYHEYVDMLQDEAGEPIIWEHVLRLMNEAAETGRLEKWYGDIVDSHLKKRGISLDVRSRARLLPLVHDAYKQAAEQLQKQSNGDYSPDPKADRFPLFEGEQEEKPKSATRLTLTMLYNWWRDDHLANGGAERTVKDYHQKLTALISFLGHEDALAVKPRDIGLWVDFLRHEKSLAAKTVADKYLVLVKRLYNVARGKGEEIANPADPISVTVPRRRMERSSGFTDVEAKTILKAASHITDEASRHNYLTCAAIRWVPWICAYTGARVNEITQLRIEDIQKHGDHWCFTITPNAGSVKTGQYRLVPIHSHLLDTGLLNFVTSRPAGYLFFDADNNATKSSLTKRAGNIGKMLSKWVRIGAGITAERVQPNHAWRHRFKTVARDVDIAHEYMNAIQGHEDGHSGTDYGEFPVSAMYREISKIPRIIIE